MYTTYVRAASAVSLSDRSHILQTAVRRLLPGAGSRGGSLRIHLLLFGVGPTW